MQLARLQLARIGFEVWYSRNRKEVVVPTNKGAAETKRQHIESPSYVQMPQEWGSFETVTFA